MLIIAILIIIIIIIITVQIQILKTFGFTIKRFYIIEHIKLQ